MIKKITCPRCGKTAERIEDSKSIKARCKARKPCGYFMKKEK